MKLHINGEERQFDSQPGPCTLAGLVEMLGMKADRVAVELNRDIVPCDRWSETALTKATAWRSSTSSAAVLLPTHRNSLSHPFPANFPCTLTASD